MMMRYSVLITVTFVSLLMLTACGGSGGYTVPTATITVDGNIEDWPTSKPAVGDPAGDQHTSTPGTDIIAIFFAQDANNIYIRIDVANGPISSTMGYMLAFDRTSDWEVGGQFVDLSISEDWCVLNESTQGGPIRLAQGSYAVSGNVIEMSIPRNVFNTTSPRYLTGSSSTEAYSFTDHAPEDGTPINF